MRALQIVDGWVGKAARQAGYGGSPYSTVGLLRSTHSALIAIAEEMRSVFSAFPIKELTYGEIDNLWA